MTYKGIIFDFNGVLLWDTPLQAESWSRYAAQLRGAPLTEAEITAHVIGRSNRYILHYLTGKSFSGADLEMHTDHKETIYRNLCLELHSAFQLSPGAAELLDELASRGIVCAIASSAGKENFLFYFLHLNLGRWFEISNVVYDDDRIATKPAPDPYLKAARSLKLTPAECAAVEDSGHGIASARAAGIGCIIALGPKADHPALSQIEGVDRVIENLSQLPVEELF